MPEIEWSGKGSMNSIYRSFGMIFLSELASNEPDRQVG